MASTVSSVHDTLSYEALKYNFATSTQQSLSKLSQSTTDITKDPNYFVHPVFGGMVATVPLYGPTGTVVGSMGTTGYNGGISSDAVYSALSAVATRGGGLLQAVGGAAIAFAGGSAAVASEGTAALPGLAVAGYGLDMFTAGFNTFWTGKSTPTITNQVATAVTGDERIGTIVDVYGSLVAPGSLRLPETPSLLGYGPEPQPSLPKTNSGPANNPLVQYGNLFNDVRAPKYQYNEVYVENPNGGYWKLDSYNPGTDIVSRKFTQLADISEPSAKAYVREAATKYAPRTRISNTPRNVNLGIAGQELTGRVYLEVPAQTRPVPQAIIDTANKFNVTIRDVNGVLHN